MSSTTKELKESLGFGLVFASVKAAIDYAMTGKTPTVKTFVKNGGIAAGVDVIYDYGRKNKFWPW